jgi:hypothetical protein
MEVMTLIDFAMQSHDENKFSDSPKKKQEGFYLPVDVRRAIEPLFEGRSSRKKWMVYVAALLSLMERGDKEISRRVGEVAAAESEGQWETIIEKAKTANLAASAPDKSTTRRSTLRLSHSDEPLVAEPATHRAGRIERK